MKSRKRRVFASIAFLAAFAIAGAAAQQFTRIAVVDLQKIIMAYSKDSGAFREFELKKTQIQVEIDKMGTEIKQLQAQKIAADKAGDKQSSQKLDAEIGAKLATYKEYVRTKQAELDAEAKNLSSSNQFYGTVYDKIHVLAESEGYSIVLNLQSADTVMSSVIWYSPMIDITDEVIQALAPKTAP
jgi:outer membrane protein